MRRLLFVVLAAGLCSVVVVGLASASSTSARAKATSTGALAATVSNPTPWLPAGETAAGSATNNWEYPEGDLSHTNYSLLKQINTTNVANLKVAWQTSLDGPTYAGTVEGSPIVVSGASDNLPIASGTMFLSANNGVVALDPTSGKTLWAYKGPPPVSGTSVAFGASSRDESFGNGMVFSGQQDGSIVGLDAKTGAPVWTTQVSAAGTFAGHSSLTAPATTFAPIGKDGIVIGGPNNGDSPLRGHIDALDAKTGALLWRWYTTPDPTQFPAILTWANPAEAALGGAAVWTDTMVDTQSNTIYAGTGNAYPYVGRQPGKDLWTDSIVAINASTGALNWYYQTVHHDVWDYDVSNPGTIFNTTINGKTVKAVAYGDKDGYGFVLNRVNGSFLPNYKIPEVPIPTTNGAAAATLNNSWPTEPEPQGAMGDLMVHNPTAAQAQYAFPTFPTAPNGLPMVVADQFAPSFNNQYVVFGASHLAGIDYQRNSYDPQTNDLIFCADNSLIAYANTSPTDYHQLSITGYLGGTVSAIDASTNTMSWQNNVDNTQGYCWTGAMSTAGGLVFAGYHGDSTRGAVASLPVSAAPYGGNFYAYDAKTGATLWKWQGPDYLNGAPITYSVNGKQYIALYAMGPVPTSARTTDQRDLLTVFSL